MALLGSNDLSIYERYSDCWWDVKHPAFRTLHKVNEFRLRQLDSWISEWRSKDVLDIGCGGGLIAKSLAEWGAHVEGIDISPASIEVAKNLNLPGASFQVGNACALPFEDESFDVVILADVLEHIDDKDTALQEAARVLRPAGALYVNTINKTLLALFLAIWLAEGLRLIPRGTHAYPLLTCLSKLKSSAQKCGLTLEKKEGEAPRIMKTLATWTIHLKKSSNMQVAYNVLFRKG